MPGISPSVMRELHRLLSTCQEFNTSTHLQTLFVDARLQPFGNSLPGADNRRQRVDNVIAHLHNRYLRDKTNALVNVLTVLAERYSDEYLGTQLYALSDRVKITQSDATFADAERYITASSAEATSQSTLTSGLEQIIGISNIKDILWLQMGLKAAKCVCRLLLDNGRRGSGFLVSDDLLLTNHHVLPTPQSAAHAIVEFNYQYDFSGSMKISTRYKLDATHFKTNIVLDYTIVRVIQEPAQTSLKTWGYVDINAQAEPVHGEHVIIIQHPGGEPKQIAMTENYVKSVSPPYIRYTTDTRPGSSGAPVFNDGWQVIALHHRSVIEQTSIRNRRQKLNEGILISQIRNDAGDFWTNA